MAKNGASLPPRKQRALVALIQNPSVAAAAKDAGVGHRTLTRWLAEDNEFQDALRDAQRRALDQTISQLASAAPRAARVLTDIACDEAVPAAVRVQAASKILSELRQQMQLVAFSDDIRRIKEILHEFEKGN
jgi:hypothetical protein